MRYWDVRRAVKKNRITVPAQQLANRWYNDPDYRGLQLHAADREFHTVDTRTWEKIFEYDKTSELRYKAEEFDCDNFAVQLAASVNRRWGLTGCGIILDYSGGHAYNAVIAANGIIYLVEPQTDKWVSIGDSQSGTEMYKGEKGIALFC